MNLWQWWRVRQIGARMAVLSMGDLTAEEAEEVRWLAEELNRMRGGPAPALPPAPEPALPPGTGTYVPRRTPTYADIEETEAQRWGKVINMRRGNPAQRNIWDPGADAVRAARIEKGKEHIKGMIPRSAMRAGHPR